MKPLAIEPNLRRLRAFMGVVRWGSVRRAAENLYLTQPTVTRAIQKLENEVGHALFDRGAHGMTATAIGQAVAARATRAFDYIEGIERELADIAGEATGKHGTCQHFSGAVTHRHLQALIAVCDCGTQSAAAERLSLSQPAVTQALSGLEDILGAELLLRTSRGMAPTPTGEAVLRGGKLALAEIAAIGSDIAERLGVITGVVTVGVLPLTGTLLVPRAVNRLLREHPGLHVVLVDGSYDALLHQLRYGELDVIVGPLRVPNPVADVTQEALFDGALSIIARKGHPLALRQKLTLAELSRWEWIMPSRATPARRIIERVMQEADLPMPANPVEANSLASVRALLIESDRVAMVSRHQIYFEERDGQLDVLPIDLGNTARPIGMATRVDASPSAAVLAFLRHLREIGRGPLLAQRDE